MAPSAIETRNLCKRYGNTDALQGVSLTVPAGAIYALVGANGAGKTTLIRILMNIFGPSSGGATVLGTPSNRLQGEYFENIGYVSENQDLPEAMTVRAFLSFVRTFYPQWDPALEAELVRDFDLPLDRKLKHLSRGMKMKAALVSVLAYRPALIVLDEPFSGLDPLVRAEFLESLAARAAKTTIFVSTHDLSEIETFATHVGYLEAGRLLFSEDRTTLSERFREIEITLPPPLHPTQLPLTNIPSTWFLPHMNGGVFHFVDTAHTSASTAQLAAQFPDMLAISIQPMSLRSIFLAMAKSGRSTNARKAHPEVIG